MENENMKNTLDTWITFAKDLKLQLSPETIQLLQQLIALGCPPEALAKVVQQLIVHRNNH